MVRPKIDLSLKIHTVGCAGIRGPCFAGKGASKSRLPATELRSQRPLTREEIQTPMLRTFIATILALCAFFWAKGLTKDIMERYAAKRKAEYEQHQRIRREDDEFVRYLLISWAFGNSTVKNAPPIVPPKNLEEAIKTLRDRDAAVKVIESNSADPQQAEQQYQRFITWFDSTGGKRELRDALPMYLLGISDDRNHPYHGADKLKMLVENFRVREQEAQTAIDKFYDS